MFCFQNYKCMECSVGFTSTCTLGLCRHLNLECFKYAVPANFVSYAPTFFVHEIEESKY